MKELRSIAKKAGVKAGGFRKAELLEALSDVQPENLTVNALRIIAKKIGTQGYAKMRKTELINVVGSPRVSEANVPISGPIRPTRTKPARTSYRRAIDLAKNEINKTIDWIGSNVREPTKRALTKRLRNLKKKVTGILEEKPDYFIPERHETALKGFLKTYIVKGRSGYDPTSFLSNVRSQFYVLMRKQKKPFKLKCIFSCGFIRRNNQDNRVIEQ